MLTIITLYAINISHDCSMPKMFIKLEVGNLMSIIMEIIIKISNYFSKQSLGKILRHFATFCF